MLEDPVPQLPWVLQNVPGSSSVPGSSEQGALVKNPSQTSGKGCSMLIPVPAAHPCRSFICLSQENQAQHLNSPCTTQFLHDNLDFVYAQTTSFFFLSKIWAIYFK